MSSRLNSRAPGTAPAGRHHRTSWVARDRPASRARTNLRVAHEIAKYSASHVCCQRAPSLQTGCPACGARDRTSAGRSRGEETRSLRCRPRFDDGNDSVRGRKTGPAVLRARSTPSPDRCGSGETPQGRAASLGGTRERVNLRQANVCRALQGDDRVGRSRADAGRR
jgi:hypothetical protein